MSIDHMNGKPPRLLPHTMEDFLRSWLLRGSGIALCIGAAFIWVAMLTWSANDPSLSINTSEPAKNVLGSPGAIVADFFIHTLGLSVILFALPPLVLGLQLALGEVVKDHRRRLLHFAAATVAIAGGCSALPLSPLWPLELGYGGIIGDFAYSLIGGALGEFAPEAGGAVVGVAFFAFGFWSLSRAICLDKYNALTFGRPRFGSNTDHVKRTVQTASTNWAGGTFARQQSDQHAGEHGRDNASEAASGHAIEDHASEYEWGPRLTPGLPLGRRTAEPDLPKWSLDAKIRDFDTDGGDEVAKAEVSSDSTSRLAARFAGPAAEQSVELPRTMPGAANQPHTIVLLDDEDAGDAEDLPNVLKRARLEAAELMPSAPKSGASDIALETANATDPAAAQGYRIPPQPDLPNARTAPREATPKIVATGYRRPSFNLLRPKKTTAPSADTSANVLQGRARMLEDVLNDFRIKGEIRDVRPGPVITQFELEPSRGTKSSRVIALADDVARSMSAVSARIAVVPGRNAIGIELPNTRRETFGLRELIDSQQFLDTSAKLPLVLGKGIGGEPILADLARMPHLLIAGTTGSGKSVGVNAMILSLIYKLGPQDCRFLMIDPKMLELSAYNGIPHLLTPVITDPQKAVTALAWAVSEMEERYKRMAELGVRGIDAFNNRVKQAARTGEKLGRTVQTGFDPATGEAIFEETSFEAEPLPHIVIVVDEFADLMAVAGKEIEGLVQRLAQMARAAGIHMIMATQRPSVDVVTGTIKANFPTRISYRVASRIDSRTILNEQGGEQLLGHGDMLFLSGTGTVQRVHGPFVSDEEVEAVTNALRGSYPTSYVSDVLAAYEEEALSPTGSDGVDKQGDLFEQAVEIVHRDQKASTSYLQRRLSIGYNRAADLIDRMEAEGIIGAADHAGRREIMLAG